ncbi:hypothetical protein HJFPF1_10838 [Paramyrothecium foliicola]|nr:hypothetical protein HJFPF1_10838 [Paramyrothecium foliicola]
MHLEKPKDVSAEAKQFRELWPRVTADSNVTLHGFRRFKTTHLLNLRFLEQEIAELDHTIYQAGLGLGHEPSSWDRLGLKHCKLDDSPPPAEKVITRELVLKLRTLLQQYDEALAAFGHVMAMETVSLLEDDGQPDFHHNMSLFEKYKTRLIRVDLGTRSRIDPFQRWLHKQLRAFRYWRMSNKQSSPEATPSKHKSEWSHHNTALICSITGRVLTTMLVGMFLITPLAILSDSSIRTSQFAAVCCFIALFAAVVGATLKVSSYEMMAASAAYAAVLSVFISNGSGGSQ